jgi:hypothetical protein
MSIHEIFGCLCLPYDPLKRGKGARPAVETAFVMPFDPHPSIPYFGGSNTKTVWETASDLTFRMFAAP